MSIWTTFSTLTFPKEKSIRIFEMKHIISLNEIGFTFKV